MTQLKLYDWKCEQGSQNLATLSNVNDMFKSSQPGPTDIQTSQKKRGSYLSEESFAIHSVMWTILLAHWTLNSQIPLNSEPGLAKQKLSSFHWTAATVQSQCQHCNTKNGHGTCTQRRELKVLLRALANTAWWTLLCAYWLLGFFQWPRYLVCHFENYRLAD